MSCLKPEYEQEYKKAFEYAFNPVFRIVDVHENDSCNVMHVGRIIDEIFDCIDDISAGDPGDMETMVIVFRRCPNGRDL